MTDTAETTAAEPQATPAPKGPTTATITLVEPIQRGDSKIERLTLRKPKAGEMRGLSISNLVNSDVGAIITLLPRISDPFITEEEAANLAAEDIAEAAGTIVGFFMSPAQKAMIAEMTGATASKT